MTYISVDVEADGPIPGDHSMICFGAVVVDDQLDKIFYGQLCPISEFWVPEALSVTGFTREETLEFDAPEKTMLRFRDWLADFHRPMFIADNNGFDWQFINWYFHHFLYENPFGYSSMNINSFYKGVVRNRKKSIRRLRKTKHTHHPVDDAMGNAEAWLEIFRRYTIK